MSFENHIIYGDGKEFMLNSRAEDAREERLQAQIQGLMNSLANSQQEVERLRSVPAPEVRLKFQNESVMGYGDPCVAVYVNGVQYDKVWAYISQEQGADGGWYNVIKFRR